MSPKKSLLIVGLSALGLFGESVARAADPGDPPAPSGLLSAPASKPTQMVLLKTNGKLLTGTITEEGRNYLVHQSGGTIPVPRAMVERTFGSLAEVYPYKRACVPERDPDERLKLAKWCLSQNMTAEAIMELRAVVAISPRSGEARAMLANLEANERRARFPQVDSEVVRSGAEMRMDSPRGNDPRHVEMNPSDLRRAQRDLNVSGLPVIFDLPPAMAVKRAELFARDVHPILQTSCAKCHNELYSGTFQLIEVKSRKALSGDVLRANLDATLRLVDAENPTRSQLLSNSLVPHGNRPNQRPIFRGSNDPRYQIIAAWVNSLRVKRSADGVVPVAGSSSRDSGVGFAVDREPNNQGPVPAIMTTPLNRPPVIPAQERQPEVMAPVRYVPGQGAVVERTPPMPGEFPIPPMLGGPLPTPVPVRPETPSPIPLPATRPTGANSANPTLPELPATPAAATTKAKKPAPPVKIDPALLERALMNRNLGR